MNISRYSGGTIQYLCFDCKIGQTFEIDFLNGDFYREEEGSCNNFEIKLNISLNQLLFDWDMDVECQICKIKENIKFPFKENCTDISTSYKCNCSKNKHELTFGILLYEKEQIEELKKNYNVNKDEKEDNNFYLLNNSDKEKEEIDKKIEEKDDINKIIEEKIEKKEEIIQKDKKDEEKFYEVIDGKIELDGKLEVAEYLSYKDFEKLKKQRKCNNIKENKPQQNEYFNSNIAEYSALNKYKKNPYSNI
jgi:hypothetical protein